jgi:ADP-dependent phosphofructokinase/glucokinase
VCRTLQRQEEAREAALKAFHGNIAARAVQAGAAAVAENRSRAEREERLMAASEAKAKAEAEVRSTIANTPTKTVSQLTATALGAMREWVIGCVGTMGADGCK